MLCHYCGQVVLAHFRTCPHCGKAYEEDSLTDYAYHAVLRGIGIGFMALALGYFFSMLVIGIMYLVVGIQGPQPGFAVDIDNARMFGLQRTMVGLFITVLLISGIVLLFRWPIQKR